MEDVFGSKYTCAHHKFAGKLPVQEHQAPAARTHEDPYSCRFRCGKKKCTFQALDEAAFGAKRSQAHEIGESFWKGRSLSHRGVCRGRCEFPREYSGMPTPLKQTSASFPARSRDSPKLNTHVEGYD